MPQSSSPRRLNRNDRRYQDTERKLVQALIKILQNQKHATIDLLCRQAGVVKSTFYRHHRTIQELIKARENLILKRLARTKLKTIEDTAVFIYLNRQDFRLTIESGDVEFIKQLLTILRPILTPNWRRYSSKIDDALFEIFKYEILGDLSLWSHESFSRDTIRRHIRTVTYLSNTARLRLTPALQDL